ncbi:hypothetical protein [uncultured Tateyamaria sp.]|uniref:hypothetical protein n=1 Tax=uncultured Tateyamaria sp. TaxID=455651 RepID=UPI0026025C02|nr:hypothetical protein [uncultured Tateyamaria sp.]
MASESKAVHRSICKVYRDEVARTYDRRKLTLEQLRTMNALAGIRCKHSRRMLASDIKLRKRLGYELIKEYRQLWRLTQADPDLHVYHITPLSDRFQFSVHHGNADVYGAIDKFTHALRQYTDLNAFGIYEAQTIVSRGKRGLETFYGHLHCIAYTRDPSVVANLIGSAKGYNAALTKVPILVQLLGRKEGDYTRLARYHAKPIYEAKKYNAKAYQDGKACLSGTIKGVERYHLRRTLELQSKLPLQNSLFGVGEGVAMKKRVLKRVRQWHQGRSGETLELEPTDIDVLYEALYRQNPGCLSGFSPMNVKYQK